MYVGLVSHLFPSSSCMLICSFPKPSHTKAQAYGHIYTTLQVTSHRSPRSIYM